jgi:HSP20 family protein
MVLMRFDPLRELDRLTDQAMGGTRMPRTLPMEALRRGDELIVAIDVPGDEGQQALQTGSAKQQTVNA